jgi:hypothetical protein
MIIKKSKFKTTCFGFNFEHITAFDRVWIISINQQLAHIWFSDMPAFSQPNNMGGYYAIILGTRV